MLLESASTPAVSYPSGVSVTGNVGWTVILNRYLWSGRLPARVFLITATKPAKVFAAETHNDSILNLLQPDLF